MPPTQLLNAVIESCLLGIMSLFYAVYRALYPPYAFHSYEIFLEYSAM